MDHLESAQRRLLRVDSLPLLKLGQWPNPIRKKGSGTSFANQRVDATTLNGQKATLEDHHNSFYPSTFDIPVPPAGQQVRPPRKSFPGLNNALNEIRSLPRRAASLRHKTLGSFKSSYHKEKNINNSIDIQPTSPDFPRRLNWFQRERHPSSKCSGARTQTADSSSACLSIPSIELETVSLPRTPTGGAAARAAAAAQNEIYELTGASTTRKELRPAEPNLINDSESGICIDIRDSQEDVDDLEHLIIRKGMSAMHTGQQYTIQPFADISTRPYHVIT